MNKQSALLAVISALLGYNLLIISPVSAQAEPIDLPFADPPTPSTLELPFEDDSQPDSPLAQITSVSELRDVSPRDWAYEALRSLVEKYRCLRGSTDQTFEGNRALTRYEFAATLNLCLTRMEGLIADANANRINQEDLATLQRLQADFATELETVITELDILDAAVVRLEDQTFSTTTILRGGVNFNIAGAFGDRQAVPGGENPSEDLDDTLTLSSLVSLSLDTSFTGRDRLRTGILAGNGNNLGSSVTGTDMTRLIGAVNTGNDVIIGTLFYEYPLGDRGIVAITPAADFPTRIFPALNPVSSISNFGAESPIYSFAFGAGTVAYYQFTDELAAGVTYLTTSGSNPDEGLFQGQYTALGQVTFTPSDEFSMALTYGRYYAPEPGSTVNITASKGSQLAQLPFGGSTATSSNALGLQSTYKLNDQMILGGWLSYFQAHAEASPIVSGLSGSSGADAEIWSWAITLAVLDVGKLGSQLNFVVGMPPKVTHNDIVEREDQDTSLHFELSYIYPLSDRIFVTPGLVMITNPEHNANNDTLWVGLMRTIFSF
ncbi:MAG: iron uptake porin [Coleofasciculus sp. G3-WIS-01]|uniref:iron uptake porin n=1 Tax=Coleofasciculus sp. G3-WIS-01 TaxID=3069528 RepID=UPI0033045452